MALSGGIDSEQDDPNARSLHARCGIPMEMRSFLHLAIGISSALAEHHKQNSIYKNLCPENILVDSSTGRITILAHSSSLEMEKNPDPEKSGSGTSFAYMSPEQMGRMIRVIDHRTDLYSLGIIFYQLLTGVLPFTAGDLLEWTHCHIARVPEPPASIIPAIPTVVSDIVMKLMAKAVEERYQTAVGLQLDLKRCLAGWDLGENIQTFPLGVGDVSERLLIPQRLYGRKHDMDRLRGAFTRVFEQGIPELAMITGYSGIGKTALVRELYKSVVREHGFFIWGKSDQYKRNIPYGIIIEAFQELIRQLLTEQEYRLSQWRVELQEALGINGQLLVEMIPQIELIIGRQPPVPELPLSQAEHRFNMVFGHFMGVFCAKAHPLVIFLDDLQWIDPASLKLLEHIAIGSGLKYLLFIGAYRDNEVDPGHPLIATLTNISLSRAILQTIHLSSLSFSDLRRLLADTFHFEPSEVEPLARLVFEKTAGNPFFVIQFLMTLYGGNLVVFNATERRWTWDIERITASDYTDNVVDLMVAKLHLLSDTVRNVLQLASCIGNRFNLRTLAVISGRPEEDVHAQLLKATQEGLLLPSEENHYAFLHDRVQQAAQSLIPETERATVHLQIGRLLFNNTPPERIEETVFELVNHFNQGETLIRDREEKYRVAGLNLLAGSKAKDATAYQSALQYLSTGVRLLDEEDWKVHYDLMFQLHKELAVVEYLESNYARSQEILHLLLARAESDLEKAELYNILIVQYTLMARYDDAIQSGRVALQLVGVIFPETDLQEAYEIELEKYRETLGDRSIASLADEPEMSNPLMRIGLTLLSNMMVPARYTDSVLCGLVNVVIVNISLKFGPTVKSAVGYNGLGMVLNAGTNNYHEAYELGLLALKISERFNDLAQKCQACFMLGHYLTHWVRHLKWTDDFNHDGFQAGLASGEMQWTGYILAYKLFQPFARGVRMDSIRNELPDLLSFTQRTRNQWAVDTLLGIRLALMELQNPAGEGAEVTTVGDESSDPADETHFLAACEEHRSFGAMGRYAVLKAQIHYLYGRMEEALAAVEKARQFQGYFSSSISVVELNFYHSLILASLFDDANDEQRAGYRQIIDANQTQMQIWAESCRKNFEHRFLIVQAEVARIEGDALAAEVLYEKAVTSAHQEGFRQNEGIAAELAARFYRQRDLASIAGLYLRMARSCYLDWGAEGKASQLDRRYLSDKKLTFARDQGMQIGHLEAITVVKASQAISGEIVIERLLETLMRAMLENAGAQKGCLILVHGDELTIAAEALVKGQEILVEQQKSVPIATVLPETMITYVRRTLERVIIDDIIEPNIFSSDCYFLIRRPKSILCLPLLRQADLIGVLYLENSLVRGAFTAGRIAVLELLAAQAVISLENALLYRERSRTEEALRQSEEKYRAIFENSGTALIFIEEDMTISICNKEFEKISGFSRVEVEGRMKWTRFVADKDDLARMADYHRLRRINSQAVPQTYEFKMIDRNRRLKDIVISVTSMPEGKQTLAVLVDISERKQAEGEHARLVTAIEQTPEAIYIADTMFVIRYVNPAFERLSGYTKNEIIGKPSSILNSNMHDRAHYRHIRETLERGDIWSGRLTNRKKDHTFFDAEVTASPVRDKTGAIINYVGIHRDITHEIHLEQELRQAQKMEAIGTLAGGIAHDFNNILTSIIGFTEMAKLRVKGDSEIVHFLDQVLKSGTRAAELVNQILTFSRQTEHKKKRVQIVTIVQEVLQLLRSSLPATIEIQREIEVIPEKSVVLADATQIHQVLMNLATNAAHAMRVSGGVMSIGIVAVDIDDTFVFRTLDLNPGPYILLTVKDNGHGMDVRILERIFDPYFTTKGPGEGSGIGLAVVQGIVKSHGGAITVQSEPGKGTTFQVFLPRIDDMPFIQDIERGEGPLAGNERILFVDDEPDLVDLGVESLEAFGYQVTGRSGSIEAWETYRVHPELFDLVVTDMTMPFLTGIELAQRLLSIRADLPVILCTGYSDLIKGKKPEELGVCEIVMKPYQITDLIRIIRRVMDR
jgi:PAS domain S-box-containing protein